MGKTQSAHTGLSDKEATDKCVLKARVHEALVQEAFRKRFQDKNSKEGQTHLDFARAKHVASVPIKLQVLRHFANSSLKRNFSIVFQGKLCHTSDRPYDTLAEVATQADYFCLNRHKTPESLDQLLRSQTALSTRGSMFLQVQAIPQPPFSCPRPR